MIKIGVIGTKGGWSSEKLADTIYNKTGFRLLVDMKQVNLQLEANKLWFQDIDLASLDALIIKKIGAKYSPDLLDRLELLRFLHLQGVKIFSSPLSIMKVLDRLSCTITMQAAGIPIPPTTITEDVHQALKALEKYEKAIFKPLYTSKARGMSLMEYGRDSLKQIQEFKQDNPIMYIQQKINLQKCDLGIAFLGGKYLTTYARCNIGDSWNTTTANGGKYIAYEPAPESIELAFQAQALFNLDFTTVDLVESDQGTFVFEVSAFGGFKGLQVARNIDAASLYVDYVLKRISHA